jgi:O-antigen/teichoic acid export membrane protein
MSKRLALSAGIWSGVDVLFRQGILFLVSLILARLLSPADFGIVALLTFFTSLSLVFVQGGLSAALVQRQSTSREEESAVFWWNLLASAVFSFVIVAAGPFLASFYGYPVLRPLTWAAAAQIMASALSAIQTALLSRRLQFRQLTKAGALSSLLGGAVGIATALLGAGVWALAWQMTTLAVANTIILWLVCDWRPQLHARLATIRHLIGFGGWISLGSILEVLYTQGFSLVVGKLYGAPQLGLYNRALGTQLLPSTVLSSIIGRIALPLFASRASEVEALRRGLRLAIGVAMLLNLPIMAGLAILAPDVIVVLFGGKWLPAAPILTILALAGILYPVHAINLQMMLARGQPRTFVRNEIAKKVIGVICVVIGSLFGILGLAWSQVVYHVLAFVVNAQPARKTMDYGPLRQLWDLGWAIFATAVMSATIILLRLAVPLSPLAALALLVPVGAAVYFAVGLAVRAHPLVEALHMLGENRVAQPILARLRLVPRPPSP